MMKLQTIILYLILLLTPMFSIAQETNREIKLFEYFISKIENELLTSNYFNSEMSLFKKSVRVFNERISVEKSEEIIEQIRFLKGGISKKFNIEILNDSTVLQVFKNKYGRENSFFKDFYFTWCIKEDEWFVDVISSKILDEALLNDYDSQNDKIIIDKIELDDIDVILFTDVYSKLNVNPSAFCFSNYTSGIYWNSNVSLGVLNKATGKLKEKFELNQNMFEVHNESIVNFGFPILVYDKYYNNKNGTLYDNYYLHPKLLNIGKDNSFFVRIVIAYNAADECKTREINITLDSNYKELKVEYVPSAPARKN